MTYPIRSSPSVVLLRHRARQGRHPAFRQNGTVAVMAAVFISLLIILLASIDIGYLFFQKRELQKIADMSALAGAQQLARSLMLPNDRCTSVYQVATDNARLGQHFSDPMEVTCGNWDKDTGPAPSYYTTYVGGNTPTGHAPPNAVRVQVTKNVNSFFGAWSSQQVDAAAIARTDSPIAVFSVGSRLLQVNANGTVPGLLSALGINIDGTSLVSYQGLANVTVTPSGLLNALGFQIPLTADVGTIKNAAMVTTSGCSNGVCTLEALLGAISVAGGQQNLVSALGLQVSQLSLPIRLFSDDSGRGGLLTLVDAANGQTALQTEINALDLLNVILGVANSHHSGNLNVTVPGIANPALQAGIVEPPSIGIGGIGTKAYSAQVRLYSNITNSSTAPIAVNLPLSIDAVNAQGTITDMCTVKDSNGNDTATIAVTAPILTICAGAIGGGPPFSTTGSCAANLQAIPLLRLGGAPTPVITLPPFSIDALNSNGSVTLSKGQTVTVGDNTLPIGTTLVTINNRLQELLVNHVLGPLLNQGPGGVTKTSLASNLLNASGNVLNSALGTLNEALTSLKTLTSTVNCGANNLLNCTLTNTLGTVGNLLNGLLNSVAALLGDLLGNIGCLLSPSGYNQCALESQLAGNQGSGANAVSNLLLSVLGLVTKALESLQPGLNGLGKAIATQLDNLLGLRIGQVDVTLIDLHCGGGPNVKLVY